MSTRDETSVQVATGTRRYRRAVAPLHFPVEETVPESTQHFELRMVLYQILKLAFGDRATVGSDQFVYWDPTDPGQRLAPDAFVRLGPPHAPFGSWKVWERGAPHVAVEIVSDSDASEMKWEEKVWRYRRAGVQELVRFDGLRGEASLRVYDHVEGDLIERELGGARIVECAALGSWWVVASDSSLGTVLRLARDAGGGDLLPTPVEVEARAREAAERRIRELEEELSRRRTSR